MCVLTVKGVMDIMDANGVFYGIGEESNNAIKYSDSLYALSILSILQQCHVDPEIQGELGMQESSEYAFCCDIHNLEKYKLRQVSTLWSNYLSIKKKKPPYY
jgi:hypothetical protein